MAGVFAKQVKRLHAVKHVTLHGGQDMGEAITLFCPSVELRQMLWKRLVPDINRDITQVPDTEVDDHWRCIDQRVSHSVFLIEGDLRNEKKYGVQYNVRDGNPYETHRGCH